MSHPTPPIDMGTLSKDEKRHESQRKGQKRAMEGRTCPVCKRGNALSTHRDQLATTRYCRYCGYERTSMWGKVAERFPESDSHA